MSRVYALRHRARRCGAITETDFGYTGQRDVSGFGLMDYRARFYSPGLGKFTQPDVEIPVASNPQTYNRFSYTYNTPYRFIDDSGNSGEPPTCKLPGGKRYCWLDQGSFIDDSHLGRVVAENLIADLQAAKGKGNVEIVVGPQANTRFVDFSSVYAVNIPDNIQDGELTSVALGIYLDYQVNSEQSQVLTPSGFSNEDIPSTYLAFVSVARNMPYDEILEILGGGQEYDQKPPTYEGGPLWAFAK